MKLNLALFALAVFSAVALSAKPANGHSVLNRNVNAGDPTAPEPCVIYHCSEPPFRSR